MNILQKAIPVITIIIVLFSTSNALAGSKADLPNDVTIELLGRCLVYSFSYQRAVSENFGVEGGLSLLGGSGGGVMFFSGGVRLYPTIKDASPCIAAGFVAVTGTTGSGPFSSDESTSYLYIGPGFEYRSSGGFLFRGTVYFLIRNGFFVWPGAQIGVAF
jgi:hypothetical protein